MNNPTVITAVCEERERFYHMANALKEIVESEKDVSEKLKRLILNIQGEVEELYLVASDAFYFKQKDNELREGDEYGY